MKLRSHGDQLGISSSSLEVPPHEIDRAIEKNHYLLHGQCGIGSGIRDKKIKFDERNFECCDIKRQKGDFKMIANIKEFIKSINISHRAPLSVVYCETVVYFGLDPNKPPCTYIMDGPLLRDTSCVDHQTGIHVGMADVSHTSISEDRQISLEDNRTFRKYFRLYPTYYTCISMHHRLPNSTTDEYQQPIAIHNCVLCPKPSTLGGTVFTSSLEASPLRNGLHSVILTRNAMAIEVMEPILSKVSKTVTIAFNPMELGLLIGGLEGESIEESSHDPVWLPHIILVDKSCVKGSNDKVRSLIFNAINYHIIMYFFSSSPFDGGEFAVPEHLCIEFPPTPKNIDTFIGSAMSNIIFKKETNTGECYGNLTTKDLIEDSVHQEVSAKKPTDAIPDIVEVTPKVSDPPKKSEALNYIYNEASFFSDDEVILSRKDSKITQSVSVVKNPSFEILKYIARGTFGVVFKIRMPKYNKILALKQIIINPGEEEQSIISAANEVSIMSLLEHRNIVKYYESFIDRNSINIVIENCDDGDINLRIANKEFTLPERIRVIIDLVDAVSYLHKRNIIHRDIKPENILFHNDILKLVDFGTAIKTREKEQIQTEIKGTLAYMAPEILLGKPYGASCDLWSVGCVAAKVIGLALPHSNMCLKEMCEYYTDCSYGRQHTNTLYYEQSTLPSDELRNFFNLCLQIDPRKRGSIEDLYRVLVNTSTQNG